MAAPTKGTKRPLRQDRAMWFFRIIQFILMLCALGVAGKGASDWTSNYGSQFNCTLPTRVAWCIACACLTLFYLLYLIPTTGPLSLTKFWNRWVQVSLDALFVIFWIAAAATAQNNCGNLCSSCSPSYPEIFTVSFAGLSCSCTTGSVYPAASKRGLNSLLMSRANFSGSAKVLEATTELIAKAGLGTALVFLFIITLLGSLYKIHEDNKAAKALLQPQHGEAEELNAQNTEYKSEPMVSEMRV